MVLLQAVAVGVLNADASRSTPGTPGVLRPMSVGAVATGPSGRDHGLLMVPPLVIVRADVSWQLAGMSRWALLVLS